jgi:hypothetical protein
MKDNAEDTILVGAYLDAQALAAIGIAATWQSERTIARVQAGQAELARRGIRLDFCRWAGEELARSELRRLSRALARLVDKGYVVRSGGRRRTTHITLTADGKALARAILETQDGDPVFLPISWEDYEVQAIVEEGSNENVGTDH